MAVTVASILILAAIGVAPGESPAEESTPSFSAEDLEFFEKKVRPILVARCYECHSGQSKEPKGGLRVDSRSAMLQGGDTGPAVVPGKPEKSLLIDAINYGDVYQMPPKSRMPPEEIAVLTQWVQRGNPWPKDSEIVATAGKSFDLEGRRAAHWCWQPLRPGSIPPVGNAAWAKKGLDRYILAALEQKGLAPAAAADRRTLIRRVYFDLIGLPPSVEEVEAFIGDDSEGSYERLVDRLLDSPHFGERWARHWMDIVRYAETCGHEFDYPIPNAWRYRDYLIRAFNHDVPYDQFAREHIAGDLLPNPRRNPEEGYNESVVGTGFWYMYEATHAPVDVRGDEAIRVDNQIDVLSKAFLGVTVACARCHDHKFDAISTKDYYALAGIVQSSRRQDALLDPGDRIRLAARHVAKVRQDADAAIDQYVDAHPLTGEEFSRYLVAAQAVVDRKLPAESLPAEITKVADESSFEPARLARWVAALGNSQLDDPFHPLYAWRKLAGNGARDDEQGFVAAREQWHQQLAAETAVTPHAPPTVDPPTVAPPAEPPSPLRTSHLSPRAARGRGRPKAGRGGPSPAYNLFADFATSSYDGWFATGEAFRDRPTMIGEWDATADGIRLARPGVAHSGQLSPEFQGVLRSPTFTITNRNIYYRLAGYGCEIRVIIDGYTMIEFHQLLFKDVKFPIGNKEQDAESGRAFRWHRQSGDLGMYLGHRAYIEILDHGDGWAAVDSIWFSDHDSPPPVALSSSVTIARDESIKSVSDLTRRYAEAWEAAERRWRDKSASDEDAALVDWVLSVSVPDMREEAVHAPAAAEAIARVRQEIVRATEGLPSPIRITAITEGTSENQRVAIRGNPRTPGEVVPRGLLQSLVGEVRPVPDGSGRLLLANQVADPDNPLTARVMVNRLWHHLFGRGIVASVDNFGVLGDPPTHPELLDFLAQQFVQEGWSIKRMLREMVLSSTYQMSSRADPRALELDPKNELLHAMRVRRLEGEILRDAVLSISGRLDRTAFGPSIPVHITPFMQGRGRPGQSGPLDGAGRRSVYLEIRRNFLSPMMLAFDMPIPFSSVGKRNVSNVPAQSLILMNDPFIIEQATRWSERLLAESGQSFSQRVEYAYVAAFARPPRASEIEDAKMFFAEQGQALGVPDDQCLSDRRLWTDYCHVLFNMKEFAFVH